MDPKISNDHYTILKLYLDVSYWFLELYLDVSYWPNSYYFVQMALIYTLLQTRRKLVIIQTLKWFLIASFFPCLILEHMLSSVDMCRMTVQPWINLARLFKPMTEYIIVGKLK